MDGRDYSHRRPFHSLCLLLCGGSAKKVKVDLEPAVDAGVDSVVLVADLLGRQALFSGLVLRRRAVLVCAADEQHVPASQPAVPDEEHREETKMFQNNKKTMDGEKII